MDLEHYEQITSSLRAHGGRLTSTRKAVIRALLEADDHHLSAADIIAAVQRVDPGFTESTVYRTLDRLVSLEVVDHLHVGPGAAVYHVTDDHHRHHHLVCDRCATVIEVSAHLLDDLAATVATDHDFVIDPDRFALTGRCAQCRRISRPD